MGGALLLAGGVLLAAWCCACLCFKDRKALSSTERYRFGADNGASDAPVPASEAYVVRGAGAHNNNTNNATMMMGTINPNPVYGYAGGAGTTAAATTTTANAAFPVASPAVVGEEPPLPPNWSKEFDESSGHHYYFNSVTAESSWERPAR